MVSEILQEMEHLAFAKGISFETDKEDKGHPVFVDKDMFKTVYRNLISNAIKYTNEGGTISIGCGKEDEKFVKFFVKDNGVGINKNELAKIRKQLDDTSQKDNFGLHSIHSRIKLYYGDVYGVEIDSVESEYTQVYIKLPSESIKGAEE